MQCFKCSKEIAENERFCSFCGTYTSKRYHQQIKCKRCKKELVGNAMFCAHCGEKTSIKIPGYLRITGIVHIVLNGLSIISLDEIILYGASYALVILLGMIFGLYVAIMMIKNSHSIEKALHLKKLAILCLIVYIIQELILIPVSRNLVAEMAYFGMVGFMVLIWIGCFSIPILYVIFTSMIEKTYLKS